MTTEPSPEQWQRAKKIVADALDLPPGGRDKFVREVCKDDPELGLYVLRLLAHEREDETESMPALGSTVGHWSNRRVGAYHIHQRLGFGGLGEVYAASRADAIRHRVAIKFIRPEYRDEQVLRRFAAERQFLALLSHPNIVRFLDAGSTDDGQPYYVMEYVEGQRIDAYCASHRLPVLQRLTLFESVCDAVQYAHNHLLVHRDLKPSNILVTPNGVPKLLDFGIAKLLRPEILDLTQPLTAESDRPSTPAYASPEQLAGEPITTASDVYSLGTVLYELLTGAPPFAVQGLNYYDFVTKVHKMMPAPPSAALSRVDATMFQEPGVSSLERRLRGEVDNIVLMAIRKEPQRRYSMAAALGDDLRRFREGLPVRAQPDSFRYRLKKFMQRRRGPVIAAAAAVLSLCAGLVVALEQRDRAEAARAQTAATVQQLRTVAHNFLATFSAVDQMCRPAQAAQIAVARMEDRLHADPKNDAWRRDLAASYDLLSDTLSRNGDFVKAVESSKRAVELREQLTAAHPEDGEAHNLAQASRARLDALEKRRLHGGPFGFVQGEGVAGRETIAAESAALRVLTAYSQLGDMLRLSGDKDAAIAAYETGAEEADTLAHSAAPAAKEQLAALYSNLVALHTSLGHRAQASKYRRMLNEIGGSGPKQP